MATVCAGFISHLFTHTAVGILKWRVSSSTRSKSCNPESVGSVTTNTCVAPVTEAITGTLTGWSLGTADAPDRFGSGLGLGAGSWARGILSTPMTYWQSEPLRLTATGGSFAGGSVRLALHWWELRLPRE